tara:strand:+ start:3446 stop:5353 length:1908 start_codon:yes stop_codon:yes gene_type:complete
MKKLVLNVLLFTLLLISCSTTGQGGETASLSLDGAIVYEESEVFVWTPELDTSGPECSECKWYYCPPLDSVWQKQICMNICEDPPTLISETECTEYLECDPTQYLIETLTCTTFDGYPGIQDKVCNKGNIQYTDCLTECYEEACNGIDDDCDDLIDEEQLNVCGGCGIVPAEVCDNVDNDCNGDTDEGLIQSCSTVCGNGYEICAEGNWISCSAPQPKNEICDGFDNDCDSQIDESLECVCSIQDVGALFPCEEDPLVCGQGFKTCECVDTECAEIVTTPCYSLCYWLPTELQDPENCDPYTGVPLEQEKCNNFDDNCNQLIDEDLFAGCYTGPPGTLMAGICEPGEMVCEAGSWGNYGDNNEFVAGLCSGEITPQEEICNGVDDNCDGIIDYGEEMKETDILFIVDWSGSMSDEISAVMIALNQFAANFSDEDVLKWGIIKGPTPDPAMPHYYERLEIVQNLTGFTDFLATMSGLDNSLSAMNGMLEMMLDAIYLSIRNLSTNLIYPLIDLNWIGVLNPSGVFGSQVSDSDPTLQDFIIDWRPAVDKIIIVFSDEYPQSYLTPMLELQDVGDALASTTQLKLYTFSRAGSDKMSWSQLAAAGNGGWFLLSNNPTQMYISLVEILDEICKGKLNE